MANKDNIAFDPDANVGVEGGTWRARTAPHRPGTQGPAVPSIAASDSMHVPGGAQPTSARTQPLSSDVSGERSFTVICDNSGIHVLKPA